jgi:hypothetical protein
MVIWIFKILNVNITANPTKYPGLSVVSGNFETEYKYRKGSSPKIIRIWGMSDISPLLPVLVFFSCFEDLRLDYVRMPNKIQQVL